jgi:hypothetical protein
VTFNDDKARMRQKLPEIRFPVGNHLHEVLR